MPGKKLKSKQKRKRKFIDCALPKRKKDIPSKILEGTIQDLIAYGEKIDPRISPIDHWINLFRTSRLFRKFIMKDEPELLKLIEKQAKVTNLYKFKKQRKHIKIEKKRQPIKNTKKNKRRKKII